MSIGCEEYTSAQVLAWLIYQELIGQTVSPEDAALALECDTRVARRLALSYGVRAAHAPELTGDFTGPVPHASRILKKLQLAAEGDRFVMTAGVPFGVAGTTNLLRVAAVE